MPVKKKETNPKGPTRPVNGGGLAIACADDCGATSEMVLDRSAAHKGATLRDKGWAVLNSPEDSTISFLCPVCFGKLEIDEAADDDLETDDTED